MPPQLHEIGFHVQNHATQWHEFQHEIQFQEVVVAWIQLTRRGMITSWMTISSWEVEILSHLESSTVAIDELSPHG